MIDGHVAVGALPGGGVIAAEEADAVDEHRPAVVLAGGDQHGLAAGLRGGRRCRRRSCASAPLCVPGLASAPRGRDEDRGRRGAVDAVAVAVDVREVGRVGGGAGGGRGCRGGCGRSRGRRPEPQAPGRAPTGPSRGPRGSCWSRASRAPCRGRRRRRAGRRPAWPRARPSPSASPCGHGSGRGRRRASARCRAGRAWRRRTLRRAAPTPAPARPEFGHGGLDGERGTHGDRQRRNAQVRPGRRMGGRREEQGQGRESGERQLHGPGLFQPPGGAPRCPNRPSVAAIRQTSREFSETFPSHWHARAAGRVIVAGRAIMDP